jgi:hypothetical protein
MDTVIMDLQGKPPAPDTGKTVIRTADLARRRRARNWALLAVLLGLSVLFYAITLVKLAKGG